VVAEALDLAHREWPTAKRAELAARLITAGARTLQERQQSRLTRRQQALREALGSFEGVYSTDYLAELRQDWPE
jgi:hypothetical protein